MATALHRHPVQFVRPASKQPTGLASAAAESDSVAVVEEDSPRFWSMFMTAATAAAIVLFGTSMLGAVVFGGAMSAGVALGAYLTFWFAPAVGVIAALPRWFARTTSA